MPAPKTVLLVEDDPNVRSFMADALTGAGYHVVEADSAKGARHLLSTRDADVVILDLQLPDGNGVELCKAIRAHNKLWVTPVIMVTGNGELDDMEAGFRAGADQYLVKPVGARELLMWVMALMRRIEFDSGEGAELKAGELLIDTKAHLVRYKDQAISNLTVKEFELLYFLVRKRPQVFSRKQILSNLWHTVAVDNVVDTHIFRLRHKLPQEVAERIQAVPGKGFHYLE